MMRLSRVRSFSARPCLLALPLLATFGACSTPESSPTYPAGCEPLLDSTDCIAPFPSDFFRVTDTTTRTGYRVVTAGAGRLITANGRVGDVNDYAPDDGFSRVPSIVAALHGAIATKGLPTVLDEPSVSATATSPTVILRADTGEFVAHYTDVSAKATVTDAHAIVLRPHVVLEPKTRYIVALQKIGLTVGGDAPAGAGFKQLRDKGAMSGALAALSPHYEADIFPVLAKAGVARSGLQLAWDFTTGSEESTTADLLSLREETLAWLDTHSPSVTDVVEDPEKEGGNIWKVFRGKIEGPRFVDRDTVGARVVRDANGTPKQDGTTKIDFIVTVPTAVRDRFEPGRYVALGHGFFGSRDEVTYGGSQEVATKLGAVLVAIDWTGYATPDGLNVAGNITGNPAATPIFRERVYQGLMNWIVASKAMTTVFPTMEAFKRPLTGPGVVLNNKGVSNAGQLMFDPSTFAYFGASQGQILGVVESALNPDFTRYAFNVGGGAYTHMIPRASPFSVMLSLIRETFEDEVPNPLASEVFIAGLARKLEPIDPAIWSPYVLERKLPRSPADRQILVQLGLCDAAVPNVAQFLLARTLKLSATGPTSYAFGLPQATGPLASGLTVFDFGHDRATTIPYKPVEKNDVHEGVRTDPNALLEMANFYDGQGVVHPCTGACKAGSAK